MSTCGSGECSQRQQRLHTRHAAAGYEHALTVGPRASGRRGRRLFPLERRLGSDAPALVDPALLRVGIVAVEAASPSASSHASLKFIK